MQRTALYAAHLQAGGRMVPFAGWEMPVQYAGILQEVQAVRQRWGVFDVSHMARAYFRGADARAFLSRLVPSDLGKVAPMAGQYTVLSKSILALRCVSSTSARPNGRPCACRCSSCWASARWAGRRT